MKKLLFGLSSLLLLLGLAPSAFAEGFVPLAVIPGLTDSSITSVVNSASLALFFNNLYKYAIGLAAVFAVIEIIWGGLEISTQDSVSKNQDGKQRIYNAIFGLVLVLAPALVFSIINPAILNLSLNLPPLDTRSSGGFSATAPATLSQTDLESRQQWGQVFETFSVSSSLSPRDRVPQLDAKQTACTQLSGGTGVILPQQAMQGGSFVYVCQACPENTTLTLYAKGTVNDTGQRGTCQGSSAATPPTSAAIPPFYSTPPVGKYCLTLKDTSSGAYYCAADSFACTTALNGFGRANVVGSCTQY